MEHKSGWPGNAPIADIRDSPILYPLRAQSQTFEGQARLPESGRSIEALECLKVLER
jgi:hypothetical protein